MKTEKASPSFNAIPQNITVDGIVPPNSVLLGATSQLESCVVIGEDKKGGLYLGSSHDLDRAIELVGWALEDLRSRK